YTVLYSFFFFFSSRRRHTRCYRDWSSDVCSSDLSIRGSFHGDRSDAGEHSGVRAGFAFLASDRVLRSITISWTVLVLGLGAVLEIGRASCREGVEGVVVAG